MKKGIKILTVEDSKEDLVSVQEILSKDFINHSLLNVSGKIDFIKGLNEFKPDIILSNFTSAEFNGFDAIEISKELYPYTPIIIVPGSIDEDTAVECINKGAEDSIIKENIKELGSAIKGALENKILKRERDLEKRIMKLNRTYAVIYRINKMIVNIQDKEILFEEACKIAVESGKFRLAWISLLDEENKVLRPCFWDGLGFEFLEEIKNLSVDDIKCKYPVPAEILKGDFIVYNKIENESGLYFGNNGHKHYFHSLISMPLKLQNKVIGSFNICTDKLESFNNDEINLLNEVTRDISFSLESISNEKALKESEEKFRMITENSADAIFIADKQGKYLYVNNKAVDLLGYSKEEMMTFTLADISPNDRVRDYFQLFNKLLHNQSVFAEIELIKKDGNIILTDLNAVLLPNGFIYASCRDISEEKMVKQRLQESEELFRHSFDYAAVGFCMVGIDKKFQRINKTFEEIIGYNEDELRNLTFSDITHPEDLDIGLSNFNKMLEEEINSASYEKRYIRKDKRIIWVYISISLVRNADKQPQFFITQIIDITERKRSENLISIFAQSLKSINEIVSITDMDDNLLYVNESYLKTYGYEENELIGRHAST
ncbi:MAG: PAS domain S-box protein, partial [Ignavibacteriaceae bacterium]|nr:PAS domain S-box protein [Ignavibacteriaceae bacterium]